MATSVENRDDNIASFELSAPQGWKKTLTPKKSGPSRRNSVIFISPTGEEIKSKRQLDQYLKSHPGGPSSSEFDWSTGETPRRSRRLSEKSKATESPEGEPPEKRQSKSSSGKVEGDADAEEEAVEESDVGEKTEKAKDVDMKEGEDAVTAVSGDKDMDKDQKTEGKDVKGQEVNVGRTEDQGTDDKTTAEKDEEAASNSRTASVGIMEEAEKQKGPEVPLEQENAKAYEKAISNSEEKIESISLPTQDLGDGKEGTEKQLAETGVPSGELVHNEIASLDNENTHNKEDPTPQFSSDNLKAAEEGSRPTTNYSIHHEDKTPHEPKASQVSC